MLKSDCKRLDRTLWSKASNAAEISRLTRAVKEPLSIDFYMSSVTLSRAVSVECKVRALRRCYFIGGGAPVDLGRRRRRAPSRRPRLIGGGVAGKHRRRRRLVINYWKLAIELYCGITFKRKQTTNESYYYCSQHFRLNFVGPIFI